MANFSNYGSTSPVHPALDRSNSSDFSQISETIGTNIFTINNGSSTLERIIMQIGTSKDKPSLRDTIHPNQQTTNAVIFSTTKQIKRLAALHQPNDKQKKLRIERLKNEFQLAVERYHKLQKQLAEKIRTTYAFQKPTPTAIYDEDNEMAGEKDSLLREEALQKMKQQQVLKDLEFDQALMEERDMRIRQIEEDILDVNEIFRDLGSMVHEQGETINTIEANIDHAYHNVDTGAAELRKASQLQQKYRKKLCCLAVIVSLVGIALIVTLVLTLKKT